MIILGFTVQNNHWKRAMHLTFLNTKDGENPENEDSSNKSDKVKLSEV
jgi:hypothetical protein